jgi:hypothetical protein
MIAPVVIGSGSGRGIVGGILRGSGGDAGDAKHAAEQNNSWEGDWFHIKIKTAAGTV